jgi:putative NADH-flavin reductase
VTAIVRDPSRADVLDARVAATVASITDPAALAAAIEGTDAVVIAYRAEPDEMMTAARALLDAARRTGVHRFVWTGGTGTLQVPGGGADIVDQPGFPAEWKARTLAHRDTLRLFRREAADLDWTYVSPPALFAPGERTGSYRVGGDELLLDESGESRISAEDLAVAVLDLLERSEHRGARITLAY